MERQKEWAVYSLCGYKVCCTHWYLLAVCEINKSGGNENQGFNLGWTK
uniref:Uncharacterized protein n=1 Tax=Anguilla anguilla TaxID=7936 RepID=A0A0E9WJF0_ANGAN